MPGDLAVTLDLAGSRPFVALVPDVTWSGAAIAARLQGEIAAPRVTADVTLRDLATRGLRIAATKLALDASIGQGFEGPIGATADLQVSGVTSSDSRLTSLLADGIRLNVAGSVDRSGTLVADKADLRAGALRLIGTGSAEKWGAAARRADATLTIADIAAIGAPLGLPGEGGAEISMKLEPAAAGDRLEVNGTSQSLSLGQPILDQLLGPSPRLHLALEGKVPQDMTIASAQVIGAKVRLDAQGTVANRDLDLSFTASVDDVTAIDPAMRGQVMMDGTVYGTMDAPSVAAEVNSPALTIASRSVENLKLSMSAADLLAKPKIELDGMASLDRLPASVATSVVIDGERIAAQNLMLAFGKSRLTGDIARSHALFTGKLALDSPDLTEVGGLVGTAMSGHLSSTLVIDGANGRQGAVLSATGNGVSVTDRLTMQSLDLKAKASDLFGAPAVTADLALLEPVIAGRSLTQVLLAAKGPLSALEIKLSLTGPDLKASAEAEIARSEAGYRIGLRSLAADVKDIHIESQRPATIEIGGTATRIEDVALAVEDGTVHLDGTVAEDELKTRGDDGVPAAVARARFRTRPSAQGTARWRRGSQRHASRAERTFYDHWQGYRRNRCTGAAGRS